MGAVRKAGTNEPKGLVGFRWQRCLGGRLWLWLKANKHVRRLFYSEPDHSLWSCYTWKKINSLQTQKLSEKSANVCCLSAVLVESMVLDDILAFGHYFKTRGGKRNI